MVKKQQKPYADSLFLRYMIGADENPLVGLLEEVHACGSINQAAKTVGMSYKAAWERIETVNNLSPQPLITRRVGGSGGGGTQLTEAGHDFLRRSNLLRREFTSFLNFFYYSPEEAFTTLKTLRRMEMKISARNVWLGNVVNIETGAVNTVVTVALKGRDTIVSVITENSVQRLGPASRCWPSSRHPRSCWHLTLIGRRSQPAISSKAGLTALSPVWSTMRLSSIWRSAIPSPRS